MRIPKHRYQFVNTCKVFTFSLISGLTGEISESVEREVFEGGNE